ncbi:MAG: hemerythrin domain-containing protein [Myxococcota bacterium]
MQDFLGCDRDRLEALLDRATRDSGTVDEEAYEAFRRGLLQHIAMEEKVLFPALRPDDGPLPDDLARLRKDHGYIAHQLVIRPTPDLVADLRAVLDRHNALEEGDRGVYARADALPNAPDLVAQMKAWPTVKVAPYRRG